MFLSFERPRRRADRCAPRAGWTAAAAVLALCLGVPALADARLEAGAQTPFTAQQLANYRLTFPVFRRFAHASRLMAVQLQSDSRFTREPLFSRDVSVAGDAVEMATALRTRLDHEPSLAAALFAADIGAHEFVTFALALFGARLAHGFLESGALRLVPPGVAADNVAFVGEHLDAIRAVLTQLGLE